MDPLQYEYQLGKYCVFYKYKSLFDTLTAMTGEVQVNAGTFMLLHQNFWYRML
jgi:hypothetical protein